MGNAPATAAAAVAVGAKKSDSNETGKAWFFDLDEGGRYGWWVLG